MRKTLCTLVLMGLTCAAISRVASAEVKFEGDTATFEFPSDDRDLAQLDKHPEIKTIIFGGSDDPDDVGPHPPYDVTDAGFAHVANCRLLEKIMLIDNEIPITGRGTAHFAGLTNLEELWLDGIRTVGDGTLRTVSKLTKLRVLRFHGAPITDKGIAQIGGLTALEDLLLGYADVGDAGMETIGKLTKLKTLDLQHTRVTDVGMAHLDSLKLKWLCLNGTSVGKKSLGIVTNMTDLEWIFWQWTWLDDASLDHVARLTKLKSIGLSGTHITEAGLAKLTPLQRLEGIAINDLPIGDAAIPSLIALHGLKTISASGTRITDAGFKKLAEAGIHCTDRQP
jgi:Leucine Rich repeat